MNLSSDPFERFCLALASIPKGKVCSYGRLAQIAEIGHARQSCFYLRKLPANTTLPWHRIVTAQGKISQHANAEKQKSRLMAEGVAIDCTGRIPKEPFFIE